jgi:hypothetical protein
MEHLFGDLSPLFTALVGCDLSQPLQTEFARRSGVKPPQAKAVTGHRTPKRGMPLIVNQYPLK